MTREEIVMQAIREVCDTTTPERFAEMNETACKIAIRAVELSQPSLPSDIDEAAEDSWAEYEYRESPRGLYSTCYVDGFKAGAEWQSEQYECIPTEESYMRGFAQGAKEERERMKDEHAQDLLYVCQKTAEREHRSGVREGKAQAEKELTPLINRLCEAILFEWKDAADLARKTLTQIKAQEEEK